MAHPRSVSVLSLPSMSVHVPCPWKIPLVRTHTKSYDPSSQIVNVTQSSPCTLWVAFNIPAHFPAALLNAETETGVDGGGGSGSTGAHPINPMTPHTSIPKQRARSHSFIIVSSSASAFREHHNNMDSTSDVIHITRPYAVHAMRPMVEARWQRRARGAAWVSKVVRPEGLEPPTPRSVVPLENNDTEGDQR